MDRRSFIAMSAAAGVGVYLWSPWRKTALREVDYPRWCVEEGSRRFSELPFTSLKNQSAASLAAILTPAVAEIDTRAGSSADAGPLLVAFSDFLFQRFVQDSPERYRAWRGANGYIPRTMTELTRNRHAMPESFSTMVGRPLGDNPSFEASFDAIFRPALDYSNGLNRPARIAIGKGGLAMLFRPLPADGDPERPPVAGSIPSDLWRGMSAANATSWWTPPVSLSTRDQKPKPDSVAEVGLIIEYADGRRFPTQSRWLFSRSASRWFIDVWTTCNFPLGLGLSSLDF